MVQSLITNNPDTLALVVYHRSDGYQSSFGGVRWSFYNGYYIPDMRYDGLFTYTPPDEYPMEYTDFASEFAARAAVPSDVAISLAPRQLEDDDFEVTAHVCVEAGGAAKTMRAWVSYMLDTYPGKNTHVNTNRGGMALGDVTVSPGQCQDVTNTLAVEPIAWANRTEIQLVGWAQAPLADPPAEVYQATKTHWPDLAPAFGYSPQLVFATVPVQFTDATTGSASVVSRQWDFGDGGTSTDQNPVHIFTQVGTHPVTLRVDGEVWSLTSTQSVEVWDAVPPAPGFHYSPAAPAVGQTVYFFDTTAGYATGWAWDFGDGGTSTEPNPSHAFAGTGLFTVTLTATNQWGNDSAPQVIEVGDADGVFSDGFESGSSSDWSVTTP